MYSENDKGLEIKERIYNQIANFQKICRNAKNPPEKTVHELRKSIKRIRALFRFLKPLISDYDFHHLDEKFARIARSLTFERESTVNLETYQSLAEIMTDEFSKQSRSEVLRFLEKDRKKAYSHWLTGLNKSILQHQFVVSKLMAEVEQLALLPCTAEMEIRAVENTYFKCIRYYNDSVLSLQTEIIHKWRKELKRLLFQIKFGVNEHFPDAKYQIDLLDKITDILGKDHDLSVLEDKIITSHKIDIPRTELLYLSDLLEKERSALQKKAFILGKELTQFSFTDFLQARVAVS